MRPTPAVARAQLVALRFRLPFLYAIIVINTVAMMGTHIEANPLWQIVLLPGVLIALMVSRMIFWIRLDPDQLTDGDIDKLRRTVVLFGALVGFLILFWASTLNQGPVPGEDPVGMHATGHAVFFVAITMMSSLFLLMHHRLASIVVGFAVVIPFAVSLFLTHRPVEMAIGVNVLLVAGAIVYVAISFSRHFDQSVIDAAEMAGMSTLNARLAVADALTSLPNRRQFFGELEAAGAGTAPFAVIICDLDGFKQINDVFGHQAGDEVLRQIATPASASSAARQLRRAHGRR